WGKKYVLSTGREVDLSCDQETEESISVLGLLNHFDPIHDITKPLSIRLEWGKESNDPIVSLECRGGAPKGERPVSESEMPVEGLNGMTNKLTVSELTELLKVMQELKEKVTTEKATA
ncbi:MAG TPA: hypothetical protein V6C96_00750, partial [Vampirovibrionales bacterium]